MPVQEKQAPAIPHERYCPLVDKGETPRLESFPYLADDPVTGRSRVTHIVDRCLECGAANYTPRS